MRRLVCVLLLVSSAAAAQEQPPPLTRAKRASGIIKIGSTPPTSVDVGDVSLRTGVGGILLNEVGSLVIGKHGGPFEAQLDYRIQEDELIVSVETEKVFVTVDNTTRQRAPMTFKISKSPRRVILKHLSGGETLSLILFFEPLVPGPPKGVLKLAPRPSPTQMATRVPGELKLGCLLTLEPSKDSRLINVIYEITADGVKCSLAPASLEP